MAIVATQGSAVANTVRPYGLVICAPGQSCPPGSPLVLSPAPPAGTTQTPQTITATFTNENPKRSLLPIASANLTAPSGVTIVSAAIGNNTIGVCPAKWPWISCISNGTTLELRSLLVPPGASLTVNLGVDTPAASSCTTTTPCDFSVTAEPIPVYLPPASNWLNLDASTSQLGIALSSETTCTANPCSASLADGGAAGSTGGSVSITASTAATSGNVSESLDYGTHINPADCSGINSQHDEYVSGTALQGASANPFQVTISTTDYSGYEPFICMTSSQPFIAMYLPGYCWDPSTPATVGTGAECTSTDTFKTSVTSPSTTYTIGTSVQVTQPDGTPGYAGLLLPCATSSQDDTDSLGDYDGPDGDNDVDDTGVINCSEWPGVSQEPTSNNPHVAVVDVPAGFDSSFRN